MTPGLWEFRGAPQLRDIDTADGVLAFSLFVDLGFQVYREIDCVLEGVFVKPELSELAADFAETWAANSGGVPLEVHTIAQAAPDLWAVRIGRTELSLEPPHNPLGISWLADALAAQGLAELASTKGAEA